MEEKHLNISKVIITIVSALILVAIITALTIILTNKKQAAEVVADNPQASSATKQQDENVWIAKKNEPTNNINTVEQNITTQNTIIQNIGDSNTIAQNVIPENAIQNNVEQNNIANNNQSESQNKNEVNNTVQNNNTEQKKSTDNKKSNNGVIWLTFDDGPSANITPKVLDILKKENIKATFFVINYSESNEHLVKRVVAEGHTIGIHGYSHEYSKIYKSKETFMNNVYTLQDRIYKSTGVKSMYTRFPGGSSNTVSKKYCKGIMTELTKEMLAKGFKYYDWNISSGDAGGAKNAKDVYKNVTKNLSKKRGNMVLMHDFGSNKKGLEALPEIIKYAKNEGYTFAKIDDDTPMYAQHVNN